MAVRPSFSVTVAVVFFLFEVALARAPSSLHKNEVAVGDSLLVSDVPSVLRLPSAAVNDESHSDPDPNLEGRVIPDPELAEPITVRSVPLTLLRFHDLRPINRHFPLRSRFPFRHCRHHHHHPDHPFFKPTKKQADIPYGDDMILSAGQEGRDLEPVRWVRLPYRHHHHDDDEDGLSKFVLKHGHRFGREKLKKHLHHNDHQDIEEEENEEKMVKEERKQREHGKKEEGGFARRIRKFLDHHF